MKNKKAISDLIGWVLLIGFTITIAAFVTTWVIDQTKKFNPEDVAGGLKVYCEDVMLSIDEISKEGVDSACDNGAEGKKITLILTLKNKGKFSIYDVKSLGGEIENFPPNYVLEPGNEPSDPLTLSFCKLDDVSTEIEIVPEIEVEDKRGYCSENTLIINDEILSNAK